MKTKLELDNLILLVTYFLGCIYGRTYMQKIFFLIENELFDNLNLNFIKYNYGPYSRELRNQVQSLISRNLLNETINFSHGHEGHCFRITKTAEKKIIGFLKNKDVKKLQEFCLQYQNFTPSELLRFVYQKYPEWTENSVLV